MPFIPIPITSPQGFEIQAPTPIDNRFTRPTLAARNELPAAIRYEGLIVYVIETGGSYQLVGGIDNSNWVPFGGGSDLNVTGNDGDLLYYDTDEWVALKAPIYYPNTANTTHISTPDTVVQFDINAATSFNTIPEGYVRSVAIAPFLEGENPFAVWTEDGLPIFDIRSDNTIRGKSAIGELKTLFNYDVLRVDRWSNGSEFIDISDDLLLSGFTDVFTTHALDIQSDHDSLYNIINFYSTLTDANSPVGDIAVIDVPIDFQLTSDRTLNNYSGLRVLPFGNLNLVNEFNAFHAIAGNLLLEDGVINVGNVSTERGNALINLQGDFTHDYLVYAKLSSGVVGHSVNDEGKGFFQNLDIFKRTISPELEGAVVSSTFVELVKGQYRTNYAELMSVTLPTVNNKSQSWILEYAAEGHGVMGSVIIYAEYQGGHPINIGAIQRPVLQEGSPDPIFKIIKSSTSEFKLYVKCERDSNNLRFITRAFGDTNVNLPESYITYSVTTLPTGDVIDIPASYEENWTINRDGDLENTNTTGVTIKQDSALYFDNVFEIVPDYDTQTVNLLHGGRDTNTLVAYIDESGNIGVHTNTIVEGEATSMAGNTGITNLVRVGTQAGVIGQSLHWDDSALKYLPKTNIKTVTIDLTDPSKVSGGVYVDYITAQAELQTIYVLTGDASGATTVRLFLPDGSASGGDIAFYINDNTTSYGLELRSSAGDLIDGLVISQVLSARYSFTNLTYIDAASAWASQSSAMSVNSTELDLGSVASWDFNNGSSAKLLLDSNLILSVSNIKSGKTGILRVIQDDTGNHTLTLPVGSDTFGDTSITPTANSETILSVYYDGTRYKWTAIHEAYAMPSLDDIVDVSVESAYNGNYLRYTDGIWMNSTIPAEEVTVDNEHVRFMSNDVQGTIEEISVAIDDLYNSLSPVLPTAENVEYDNSFSGLLAENVQAVIDEVYSYASDHATSTSVHTSQTEKDKLATIEESADVTDTENVDDAGAIMHTDMPDEDGFIIKTAAESYTVIKANLAAVEDPSATDDSSAGYSVGSVWINTVDGTAFTCVDNSVDEAIWKSGKAYTFLNGLTDTNGVVTLGGSFDSNISLTSTESSNFMLSSTDGMTMLSLFFDFGEGNPILGIQATQGANQNAVHVSSTNTYQGNSNHFMYMQSDGIYIHSDAMQYTSDYSSSFTDRSIPDVAWVNMALAEVGGGYLSIKENDGGIEYTEDVLQINSNNGKQVVTNDSGVKNQYDPQFLASMDVDASGIQAGDIPQVNNTANGITMAQSAPYLDFIPAIPVYVGSLVDTTHTLTNFLLEKGYTVKGRITNLTHTTITGFRLTDGTNDMFSAIDIGSEEKDVPFTISDSFFDRLNDQDVYYYTTTGAGANIMIYFTISRE